MMIIEMCAQGKTLVNHSHKQIELQINILINILKV